MLGELDLQVTTAMRMQPSAALVTYAPGERFSLDSFRRAIDTAIAFYHEVSRL